MNDYINGTNHYYEGFPQKNYIFGIKVYEQIINGLKRVIDNEPIHLPIKMFYLLLEHKKIMEVRLQYLSNYLNISIGEDYREIRHKTEVCLNLYVKFSINNKISLIHNIIQNIEDINKLEFNSITEVIHKIS